MKCTRILVLILGILTGMPSFLSAKSAKDSVLLNRIFSYREVFTHDITGVERNVYMKFRYDIDKRNATLWLIPSMYPLARGERHFLMESYSKLKFKSINKYESKQQLVWGTVPHYRKAMKPILEFLTPNLYAPTIYPNHTLSPFNTCNRRYYKYTVEELDDGQCKVTFKPRHNKNTQLISGFAFVDKETGRITQTILAGDFDGIAFHTEAIMGEEGARSLLPTFCFTKAKFNFSGNRIDAAFEAAYDCPQELPDSMRNVHDRQRLQELRPIPLSIAEQDIYNHYDSLHPVRPVVAKPVSQQPKSFRVSDVFDAIGENLVTSIRARSDNASLRIYPLLSPQYLSFSHRYGVAYKIKMKSDYYFNAHRYFNFNPQLGYNFKFRKFYFTLPLRFTYNPKRDGYVELVYGNGNRTRHASIVNEIQREHGDSLDLHDKNLDTFDDNYLRLTNNIMLFDWIDIESGVTFHRRTAYEPEEMRRYGKPTEYRSFAPVLSFKLRPWTRGPLFTIDYERGIKGVNRSNIDYERWEFDGSIKHAIEPMRTLNIRVGAGFYSRKKGNYFVDYANFRDNNLPEGWDDDWTGNFQLLNSRWYNESRYYARANLSYDSPMLLLSWLPVAGHFMERERFYLSGLSIDHTRPYYELGYGFTTRFVTIGLFTSFLNTDFQEFECKFTFELFRRW